jgi:hypothetical protein
MHLVLFRLVFSFLVLPHANLSKFLAPTASTMTYFHNKVSPPLIESQQLLDGAAEAMRIVNAC